MAETLLDDLEAKYAFMSENLIGSVRENTDGSWYWMNGESNCLYARDVRSGLRMLRVLDREEDGGVSGTQFFADPRGILKILRIRLSAAEFAQHDVGEYLLKLHLLENSLGDEEQLTEEDEGLFWRAMLAPLDELQ